MQSSTLYGPVTKVTVGKYFVQVASKGVDKMKEKGSAVTDGEGKGGQNKRQGGKWKNGRNR